MAGVYTGCTARSIGRHNLQSMDYLIRHFACTRLWHGIDEHTYEW